MERGDISNESLSPVRVAVVWESVMARVTSKRWGLGWRRPPADWRHWRMSPITVRSMNRLARNNVPVDVWTFMGNEDWADELLEHLRNLSISVANVRHYASVDDAVHDIALGTYKIVYDSDHGRLERYGWAGRYLAPDSELPVLV